MEIELNGDVAGHQLLIDFSGVDEDLTNDVGKSADIFTKLFKINHEKMIACSVDDYDDRFCLYICSENILCTVFGFKERSLVTADLRVFGEHDLREIEDWLVHEYHPVQVTKSDFERGTPVKFIPRDTKKVRKS